MKKQLNKEILPPDWRWVKLGEVCEFAYGSGLPVRDRLKGLIPVFGSNGVIGYHNMAITQSPTIIIGRKGSIGQVNSSESPCWPIDTTYYIDESKTSCYLHWLYWLLKYLRLDELNKATGVPGLNRNDAYSQVIPLPPLSEQKRIAAKIKELMQEVEHARTACEKQLEAAKALPSAYLREVFKSEDAKKWESKRLGEVCETTSGGTPYRGNKEYFDGDIPWVKSGELEDNYIYDTEEKITELGLKNSSAKILPMGTLLIAMYGATVGKLGVLNISATTNQAICAIIPNSKASTNFLFFFFMHFRRDLVNKSYGGAQPNISQELIKETHIPFPSIKTQHRIAAELKEKKAEVDKLHSSIERQFEAINALPQAILRKAFIGKL